MGSLLLAAVTSAMPTCLASATTVSAALGKAPDGTADLLLPTSIDSTHHQQLQQPANANAPNPQPIVPVMQQVVHPFQMIPVSIHTATGPATVGSQPSTATAPVFAVPAPTTVFAPPQYQGQQQLQQPLQQPMSVPKSAWPQQQQLTPMQTFWNSQQQQVTVPTTAPMANLFQPQQYQQFTTTMQLPPVPMPDNTHQIQGNYDLNAFLPWSRGSALSNNHSHLDLADYLPAHTVNSICNCAYMTFPNCSLIMLKIPWKIKRWKISLK